MNQDHLEKASERIVDAQNCARKHDYVGERQHYANAWLHLKKWAAKDDWTLRSVTVTFNGSRYDYDELRRECHWYLGFMLKVEELLQEVS